MTLTDPYLEDTPELLTGPYRPSVSIVAASPAWTEDMPLDVERAQISWDETRAPRVRLALTCKVPADQDDLDKLDPRAGVRVRVTAGYIHPAEVIDAHLIADVGLRRRRVTRPQDLLEMDAASDEALVIDASAVASTVSATGEPAAIIALLNQGLTPDPAVDVTSAPVASVAVDPVTDLWATADDLADRIDADLYDNGLRRFQIGPRPVIAGTSHATFQVGINGTIMESDTALDRDDWFNAVRLVYRWDNSSGAAQTVTGTAKVTSGPFTTTGAAGVRRYAESRDVPTSQAGANAAAAAILRRLVSRGRSFQFRAISALWVRPGMTVTVQLPTGPSEQHLVSAVTFDLLAGSMSLTTRLPDNVNTIGE